MIYLMGSLLFAILILLFIVWRQDKRIEDIEIKMSHLNAKIIMIEDCGSSEYDKNEDLY